MQRKIAAPIGIVMMLCSPARLPCVADGHFFCTYAMFFCTRCKVIREIFCTFAACRTATKPRSAIFHTHKQGFIMNDKQQPQVKGSTDRLKDAAEKFTAAAQSAQVLAEKVAAKVTTPATIEGAAEAVVKHYTDFMLDFSEKPMRPNFRAKIGNIGIMPSGSITAVTGWAKQGKTQWLTAIVSVLMSGRQFGTMKQDAPAPDGVLWVDTEQSEYNIHNNIGRLYYQMGVPELTPSDKLGLAVLALRPCSTEERLQYIQEAIDTLTPELIVIDGIRDLLHDFNDINQSEMVMQWLMKNAETIPNRNIICVIHTNDGSDKMRGTIGTELFNKCEDRFTVCKKEGFFQVNHITRNVAMPEPFNFRIDDDGHLCAEPPVNAAEELRGIYAGTEIDAYPFDTLVRKMADAMRCTQAKAKALLMDDYVNGSTDGLRLEKAGKMWRLADYKAR